MSNPVAVLANANNASELHRDVGVAVENEADLGARKAVRASVTLIVHHHDALLAKSVEVYGVSIAILQSSM